MLNNDISKKINVFIQSNIDLSNPILAEKIKKQFDYYITPDAVNKRKAKLKKTKIDHHEFSVQNDELIEEETSVANIGLNEGTIVAKSKEPITQEELLKKFNIDKDIWSIDDCIMNLVNKDGDNDSYSMRIKIRKKDANLIEKLSPIKINCNFQTSKKRNSDNKGLRTALIIPDSQNGYKRDFETGHLEPFHDRLAWDLCVQLAEHIQPDDIIILGDMLDLPEWSDKFVRSPEFVLITQPSIVELSWWLSKLRKAAPDSIINYIEGNHEQRLLRAININLPYAFNLIAVGDSNPALSIPNLLDLDTLNIEYLGNYPKDIVWLNNNLACIHGDIARTRSGATAKVLAGDLRYSVIYGHIHRQEMVSETKNSYEGPKSNKAFSPGSICRIDGIVPPGKILNWQQGTCVVN